MHHNKARTAACRFTAIVLMLSGADALANESQAVAAPQAPVEPLPGPLKTGSSPASQDFNQAESTAQPSIPEATSSRSLAGFVRPAQMLKLTLAPPSSSNRLELNHFQPLDLGQRSILFFDNTIYAKSRPSDSAGYGLPWIETWGESLRLGYRRLINDATGFIGLNAGYDCSLQQGYYFQQLGVGFEAVVPGFTAQMTVTQGIGRSYYPQLGDSLLSSVNMQATFPVLIKSLSMGTRFYYVHDRYGQAAPGGQLQLIYGFSPNLSANVSMSYDNLDGAGYSLQFKYLFRPPRPRQVPQGLSDGVASAFSQAIGNTGSRIIRLTGSVPNYGGD